MARPGSRAEFEGLVQEHLPNALRFATRLAGSENDADELVQGALLNASRAWKSFRKEASFKTWLFRILVNKHRDNLRRTDHSESLESEPRDRFQQEPHEAVIADELAKTIATQVAALPARQQEVFVLSVYENQSAQSIAKIVEINVENVHATLHQAKRRLRQRLQGYLAENEP